MQKQKNTYTQVRFTVRTVIYQKVCRWNVEYFTEIAECSWRKRFEAKIGAVMCCRDTASITTYTQKKPQKRANKFLSIYSPNIDNFQKSFISILSRKFRITTLINIPSHIQCIDEI